MQHTSWSSRLAPALGTTTPPPPAPRPHTPPTPPPAPAEGGRPLSLQNYIARKLSRHGKGANSIFYFGAAGALVASCMHAGGRLASRLAVAHHIKPRTPASGVRVRLHMHCMWIARASPSQPPNACTHICKLAPAGPRVTIVTKARGSPTVTTIQADYDEWERREREGAVDGEGPRPYEGASLDTVFCMWGVGVR